MAKPRKVKEPATPYTAAPKKPAKAASSNQGGRPEIRQASAADIERANAKLMQVHREVLRKLAQ